MSDKIPPKSKRRWQPRQPVKRPLYMMVKPPVETLHQLALLPRRQQDRSLNLLHLTVLPFVDLAQWPSEFVPALLDRMDGFEADAVDVSFDRIEERKAVTLRSGRPLHAMKALQYHIAQHLKAQDFQFFGDPPDPHVTINYRGDGRGNEVIDPISWLVEEIILIESIYGEATHVVHGRWFLRRRLL